MIKILVAEDDAALNGLVCAVLTGNGFETVSCADGGGTGAHRKNTLGQALIGPFPN